APEVPEPLARIVHKCLDKRSEARYRDAGEIARQIRALDRTSWPRQASDLPTMTVETPAKFWNRRRRRLLGATATAVLAAGLVAGYKWWPAGTGSGPFVVLTAPAALA